MKDFVHVPYTPLPMRADIPINADVERILRHADKLAGDLVDVLGERDRARATAVQLEQENAHLRRALTDFAEHGVRADLMPTVDGRNSVPVPPGYLDRIDQGVRNAAKWALRLPGEPS